MSGSGLIESIVNHERYLTTLRRDLHAHPEIGFQERRTSDVIAQTLSGWNIPVHRGIAKTGIVGVIKSGSSGRAVGLRADMDALPIAEHNCFEHASIHAGTMHACGHDGHIAMLLGAAKYLSEHRNFDGTVYLIFQPAEEGAGGAGEMVKDGLFDRFPMQAIFGVHNWPGLKVGQFAIAQGPVFASNSAFKIVIRGTGAHAAFPHEGRDPIPATCQMVQAFQTIMTRNKRPLDAAVISVTMIHTGEAANVVPSRCEIQGTVRAFTLDVLDLIEQRMRAIADATCRSFELACEFEFRRITPATVNDPAQTKFARNLLGMLVGEQNVLEFEPTTAAEDFSFYQLHAPGCYFLIGNGDGDHRAVGHGAEACRLHSPSYDFNDELIVLGGSMWARLAEGWLSASELQPVR